MQKPVRPADDAKRVRTLRSLGLLDTEKDERFDRLTRLAMHIFDVPTAMVSLVDENRQWFKSCQGASFRETDRDISFCGHAILGDSVFVIQDTHQDPRFSDNPMVTGEPHIRFYAGFPIRHKGGTKLGTLCLLDKHPRHFGDRERLILEDLAKLVEHEIRATELSVIDELTEVPNRRGFYQAANHILSLCRRQALPVSLVFLDLNNFKAINDGYGHAEGDSVLKQFSSLLSDVCRQTDIAARIGGDEFALLLPYATEADVNKVLARFAEAISNANKGISDYQVSYSTGLVKFDAKKHQGLNDLLAEGDKLMYEHKQTYKKHA
jgi:diguanylate cyclase (GGDEF)-like protein